MSFFNINEMYGSYRMQHQAARDEFLCASYPVFRTAYASLGNNTIAFRHSKGAFVTCEFCNTIEHLLKKNKALDDNDPDKLGPDAIQLVAELMVLHRAKQSKLFPRTLLTAHSRLLQV